MKKNNVTGIVLSGGKSKRMGEEKGLINFAGKPLISYSIAAIKPLCDNIFISANNQPERYAQFGYEVVPDEITDIGPIGGLISCLKKSGTRNNIVLSCDIPFVSTELFSLLLDAIENFQVVVPEHVGFIEPLCAVYATNIIWEMEDFIRTGNYKLQDFLSQTNLKKVEIDSRYTFFTEELFINLNTRKELDQYG
jgi:molybdopterin-guanine dinucleotide biosynthesis protein A